MSEQPAEAITTCSQVNIAERVYMAEDEHKQGLDIGCLRWYSVFEYSVFDSMPRKKSAPSAAEYAILGLLHQQPMHGYQIAQELTPDRGLGLICPLGLSNVYFILSNLERHGLIEVDHRQQDVYPPKTVFKVTPAGKQVFESWIWRPPGRLRDVRLDFPLKLYFLEHENAESITRLLDDHIRFCKQYLSEWKALVDSSAPHGFDRLAMQSKVAAAQGTLDWLIECRRGLVRRRPDSRSPGRKRKAKV